MTIRLGSVCSGRRRTAFTGVAAVVLLGLASGADTVAAQDGPPRDLTVRAAIDVAMERNPALNQQRERVRSLEGRWLTEFGLASPRVIYNEEAIPRNDLPGFPEFGERKWTVSQSVRSPVESFFDLRGTSAEQDAARLDVESASVRVRIAVKQAYVDLVYTREILHLREQEVALARDLEEAVQTRVDVGESAELDLMKAELQAAEAESNLSEAQVQFELARYTLFQVVGFDPQQQGYEISFPDSLIYVDVTVAQGAILGGLQNVPSLQAQDQRARAAGLGVDRAWGSAFPSMELQFFSQDFGSGYDFWGFQLGFSVPLWFLLNERGAVQQAKAVERDVTWRRQEAFLALKREAEQAWHGYDTSHDVVRRYSEGVNARADELLALTREGYLLGELDLLELLDTQRTFLASRKRYWDSLRTYYLRLIELERFSTREYVFPPDDT